MTIAVLTAIGEPRWEARLAGALAASDVGLQVVRRCVDLAELLGAAQAGLAQAAVVSADLRRLDRDSMERLRTAGVAVVGLSSGNEAGERRLRGLGITQVVHHDSPPELVASAVVTAVGELGDPDDGGGSSSGRSLSDLAPPTEADPSSECGDDAALGTGRVVAIWGPAGSPGRSTVSVNLSAELCALGHSVVLVDADTYGGAVAQLLGVLDEAPGLAAACRSANQSVLEPPRLAELALELRPGLRLLTGITRPDRWPEIRPAALQVVLTVARSLGDFIVVDCGFCLEQDEELSYDTAAPRRNGATLAALGCADLVVGVAAADPVGLARYVRALPDCLAVVDQVPSLTVANRIRSGVTGPGDPRRAVRSALDRYAGLSDVLVVPEDRDAVDTAVAGGRTLSEAAPRSGARKAIRDLAVRVAAA